MITCKLLSNSIIQDFVNVIWFVDRLTMNLDRNIDQLNQQVNQTFNITGFNANDFSQWIENMSSEQLTQIACDSGLNEIDFRSKSNQLQIVDNCSSNSNSSFPKLLPHQSTLESNNYNFISLNSNHCFDNSNPNTNFNCTPLQTTPDYCNYSNQRNLPPIELALHRSRLQSNGNISLTGNMENTNNCDHNQLEPFQSYSSLMASKKHVLTNRQKSFSISNEYKKPSYQIDRHLFDQLERILNSIWPSLLSDSATVESPNSIASTMESYSTIQSNLPFDGRHFDSSFSLDSSPEDDVGDESDGEEYEVDAERTTTSGGVRKQIKLWQFLLHLLDDPRFEQVIGWIDHLNGSFRIHQTRLLSQMWGIVKGRPAMNYDKLSRSMRQYYSRKILTKSTKSTRLVYNFNKDFLLKKRFQLTNFYWNTTIEIGFQIASKYK